MGLVSSSTMTWFFNNPVLCPLRILNHDLDVIVDRCLVDWQKVSRACAAAEIKGKVGVVVFTREILPFLLHPTPLLAIDSTMVVLSPPSQNQMSINKFKGTTTDVLQGSQLLAIDVAAAKGLLRRVLIGDELTNTEKQALRRTLTDLATVIPIGFLMLLHVTAVGHATMLAAIQRYIPSLIPSTYGPERLDLLRQLEKVKEKS